MNNEMNNGLGNFAQFGQSSTAGVELDWNATITDEGEITTFPAGIYQFEVTRWDKARSKGSTKMPACNMAKVFITLTHGGGVMKSYVIENLLLHSSTQWKIVQFFRSIGMIKPGEDGKIDFDAAIGASGFCEVEVERYTTKDGKTRERNTVKKFLAPGDPKLQAHFETAIPF